jgi:hypothetical protein
MGDEKRVYLFHLLVRWWTGGVIRDPGIDNDSLAARRFDAKRRVAQPCKMNAFQFHGRSSGAAPLNLLAKRPRVGGSRTYFNKRALVGWQFFN